MDAVELLFQTKADNGDFLFKNQVDIAIQLLNDPDSKYHVNRANEADYNKSQTRLRTYISQLLSSSAYRTVTEDLKTSLFAVIRKKIVDEARAALLVNAIIDDLKLKNTETVKLEVKTNIVDEFISDFALAKYIAIITSKPLEIEAGINTNNFSLRRTFFSDFFDLLSNPSKDLKHYRFNFPLDSTAILFWKGIKRILFKQLRRNLLNRAILDSLYSKFALKTETYNSIEGAKNLTEENLSIIADEILELLNRNRYIVVITTSSPIFGMPLIAINPAESRNFKLYALLDDDSEIPTVYKYTTEDKILWRLFVWDKIKSPGFGAKEISYSAAYGLL